LATLGQVIRQLREQQNLSLAELVRRSKVAYATLWRLERGLIDPQWTTVDKILDGLDISLGELAIRVVEAGIAGAAGDQSAATRRSR
jgi:transcriptional regulator with XRE-family HTH domain